ncbi:uncharacterized protein LOC118794722 [Megalops cyprinoides]|uniref:uncharacterized protein LOC118794722 n=1 Tax=Megalops cyprinoides TaxID=118141 RepID=UPI001863F355|nr:uncharacterized protein LOC118794722 [Megalops cyprinoides]
MDPLPQRQPMEDGLPESPSACSLAFDLSSRRRESHLKPVPMDPLHVARAPRWRGGEDSRGPGLQEGDSPFHAPPPSRRVRPDDAFSNTTVTLSYVSSSHGFSAQGPLPPRLQAVPAFADGLSRGSPNRDSEVDAMAREYAGGHHRQATGGMGSQLEAYPMALPMESLRGGDGGRGGRLACFPAQTPEVNGTPGASRPWGASRLGPSHLNSLAKGASRPSEDGAGDKRGLQNGVSRELWDLESSREKPSKLQTTGGSYFTSRPRGIGSPQGSRASGNFHSPLNKDCIVTLEEPLSPGESSSDEMEDALILPQALNSPSAESCLAEEAADDITRERPVKGEGTKFRVELVEVSTTPEDSCSNDSDVIEVPVSSGLTAPLMGVAEMFRTQPEPQDQLSEPTGPVHPIPKKEWNVPEQHLNGNALEEERTAEREKSPACARQGGMRLEAVVRSITPFRCKSSGHIQPSEKCTNPKTQASKVRGSSGAPKERAHESEVEEASVTVTLLQEDDSDGNDVTAGGQKSRRSTSGQANASLRDSGDASTSFMGPPIPAAIAGTGEAGKGVEGSPSRVDRQRKAPGSPARAKMRRRSRAQPTGASPGGPAKNKKRKKRGQGGQSSMFSPKEPEIKLKYATYREEKREARADAFAPYVRLDGGEFSTCTVVNYPEEENGRKKGSRCPAGPGSATGAVPTTSCLQLGRLDAEGRRQREQVCCLCGHSANVMDLGDLHGPYRPHGRRAGPGAPSIRHGPEDNEACSDSDSSCYGRGWKPGAVQEVVARHGQVSDAGSPQSPAAKRRRLNPGDQSDTPTPPANTEFWVHEDCGVWSAGVFLVRGKLYGLEEAIRLAQETVCSACHGLGATLGCFFKGCPSKYHYSCAVQSDCMLNEDNFTMKCPKHKNKSLKGVSRMESR